MSLVAKKVPSPILLHDNPLNLDSETTATKGNERFQVFTVFNLTRLRAGRPGFDSRYGRDFILFAMESRSALGPTRPPIQWVQNAPSLWIKRPGCKADHSRPSRAEVKNGWSYTSIPPYVFMAWCLVKYRDNFTFTLVGV
jgi:hypothetical protein